MNLEEIKELKQKAYKRLKRLDEGVDYETEADCYEGAFDIVDNALSGALQLAEKAIALLSEVLVNDEVCEGFNESNLSDDLKKRIQELL